MEDMLTRFVEDLLGRVRGPMNFRLILQPLMAIAFALRDGRRDARAGRAPYFWSMFTNPEHRRELLRDGWKSVGKVFIAAVVFDVIYQLIVLRWVYPGEAIIVALILAALPYMLLRGAANRVTAHGLGGGGGPARAPDAPRPPPPGGER